MLVSWKICPFCGPDLPVDASTCLAQGTCFLRMEILVSCQSVTLQAWRRTNECFVAVWISWRKWALKGLRQMCALFSLFHFIYFLLTQHSYNDQCICIFTGRLNKADHLCHFLTREVVWSQYRTESQTHRILGWKGTSMIIWSNKYLHGSSICDTWDPFLSPHHSLSKYEVCELSQKKSGVVQFIG